MKTNMLEYYQQVLDKISLADAQVFRKELRKAFKPLLPEQRAELKAWFRNTCVCKVQPDDLRTMPVQVQEERSLRR
ncbi:MAG TPA: hypothetical protein PLN54_10345 [Flavobacteriales bacterium]|nr:hypothetical protein [Flavobacteriales bacterium]